jgi:LacI family transcriptional regulator
MAKKVNLKTIANDLNLSVGTISRVLNGKAEAFRISPKTVKRVLEYAEKIGYEPNLLARSLKASKTYTIGLVIPDIANPYFGFMAKSIIKAAEKEGYSIFLVDTNDSAETEQLQIKNLVARKVDGIIVSPVGGLTAHFEASYRQQTPLIFIDNYIEGMDLPYVTSDNFQGAYDATKLLIENGHRKIVFVHGEKKSSAMQRRYMGYKAALEHSKIKIDEQLIVQSEYSVEKCFETVLQLFTKNIAPTAVLAANNQFGLGIIKVAKEKQLQIPKDLSLIIFDDEPYATYLNPPITTVKQNVKHLSERTIHLILKSINGLDISKEQITVPTNIILRKSVSQVA